MKYKFSASDYIALIVSYILVGLYAAGVELPAGLPDWILLAIALLLNLWTVPLPGLHSKALPKSEKPQITTGEAPALPEAAAVPAEKPSSQDRLEQSLGKTQKGFISRIAGVFKKAGAIDDSMLASLEETLVGSDVGIKTAYMLFEEIQQEKEKITEPAQAMQIIKQKVNDILSPREAPLAIPADKKPFVIMVTGVNGAGKTTTIAKMAHRFISSGKSVIIASGDTYRAAAIEQLEHWADKVGADFIKSHEGADPSSVAFDGLQAAIAREHDILIIDTAGRLHTKENLMDELKKTRRVLDKKLPGCPHEILLVLDATQGQNAIEQTRQFGAALDITGIALTKLDGSAKGGVIVGIANEFEIPIRFIGVGEAMDDLQDFRAEDFVNALFLDNKE